MIYFTGDTHGSIEKLTYFVKKHALSDNDIIVVLGDAGFNYYGNTHGDAHIKKKVNQLGVTVFCIHGNHEQRPEAISSYSISSWRGGAVFVEQDYPNLLFAKDGEVYDLDGHKALVLGGAYSVDKYYRLLKGYHWFENEQPDEEIKAHAAASLKKSFLYIEGSAQWDFMNLWGFTYSMKYNMASAVTALIQDGAKFIRCIKPTIRGLSYKDDICSSGWLPITQFWGHPHVLTYKNDWKGQPVIEGNLYFPERVYEDVKTAISEFNREPMDLNIVCEDIFADG